jgi:hypothetical protein
MRQKTFLQKLRASSLRLTSKRYSGMMLFLLTAPTAEMLREAREHLRYWPYVKAFKPVDATHMNVLVFIGKGITDERWDYYVTRSCELMNQCLRQYQAYFVVRSGHHLLWLHKYHSNGFLRPNDLLKPFCDFIDEM